MEFMVFPKEKDVKRRIFRGSKRALRGRAFHMYLKDILKLCSLSLQTSLSVQTQQVLQQMRACAIGNQISPLLADIAVSFVEQRWWEANQRSLRQHRCCIQLSDVLLSSFPKRHQLKLINFAVNRSHKMAAVNSKMCLASRCSPPQFQRERDVQSVCTRVCVCVCVCTP